MVGSGESPPQPATPPATAPRAIKPAPAEPQPGEPSLVLGPSAVTAAALASIVAVRQPIHPEFPQGGFVALIPAIVVPLLAIMFAGWAVVAASNLLLGLSSPFAPSNPFARQRSFSSPNPFLFSFPNQRR